MEVIPTTFSQRFLRLWPRWWLWIACFGLGYHGGRLIAQTFRGNLTFGLLDFVTGVVGYAIGGIILGALIALILAAVPHLRLWPTSLTGGALRAIVIGLGLGLAIGVLGASDPSHSASAGSLATAGPSLHASSNRDRSVCLSAYNTGHYKDGIVACHDLVLAYVPRLRMMARSSDARVILGDSWDLLRITYVEAFAEKQIGEPENARQSALHCVGWAIYSLGAIEELAPKETNTQLTSMKSEIRRDLRALDAAFPGVMNEERKATDELAR